MEIDMKKEDCEGCQTKEEGDECIWFVKSLSCPCVYCLIKVMCLTRCELLATHTNNVYKEKGLTSIGDKIDYVVL